MVQLPRRLRLTLLNRKAMNRIKYIILAAVAILGIACQKEQVITETDNSGYVDLKVAVASQTRATEFVPDNLRVRIYDAENRLIRVYTSLEDLEAHNPLALVAGTYTVKVEGGDKSRPAFTASSVTQGTDVKKLLYYTGEATMTVEAGKTEYATVNCMANNVKMDVAIAAKADGNENDKLSDIVISMAEMELTSSITNQATFNTAAKDLNKVTFGSTSAGFTGSDTAYLLLEDVESGKSKIAWSLVGKHTKGSEVVEIDKVGEIEVEPGKAYRINYTFSKAADGTMTVTITVNQTADGYSNEFDFKPQPEFGFPEGSSWSATGTNTYVAGTEVGFVCESSVSELATLSYKIGNVETQIWSNDATRSGEGVSDYFDVTSSEGNKTLTIKAKQKFFELFGGGEQEFAFKAVDKDGGDATYDVTFKNQGLLIDKINNNVDLWANTATFQGVVTATGSPSVKVQFRKKGYVDGWATTGTGTVSGTSVTGMISTAAWITKENDPAYNKNHTVYIPDVNKSIFANNTYECQLVVNNVPYGPIVEFSTGGGQTIPDGDFEDSGLDCFEVHTDNDGEFWGSGNNGISDPLCYQDSKTGAVGNKCVRLQASGVSSMEMLASGNLFTGTFHFTDIFDQTGTVSFGVKYGWTARPSAMKLRIHHTIGNVNYNKHSGPITTGSDEAVVQVCIVNWGSPHNVSSGKKTPTGVWSPENGMNAVSEGEIIGYGVVYPTGTTPGDSMVELEIPIYYYDKGTKPSKNYTLVISAATSRYGDYMNGCSNSNMYVDDFQWVY